MALVLADRVLETCTSPGTGAVTLLGAATGYQTFSAGIGNGNTCYYCIADQGGANWEVGIGSYSSSGNTLTRTTPISGSAATPVNFSSGTQNVFVTYPAEKSVNLDGSGKLRADSNSYLDFASAAPATIAGRMWYDGTTGSWNLGMGGGNITQQVGEELFIYGKASSAISGNTILQLVFKTGTVGASGVLRFAPTTAGITDANLILGVATEHISAGNFGRITTFGIVRGVNTTGSTYSETWADGDTIWYNPTTGGLTKTEPTAPNIKYQVGTIINAASAGSGSFQVDLHPGSKLGGTDSNVQFGTLATGNLIQYNGTYWANVTPGSITGIGSVANAVTFNNSGSGAASGTTFDGSAARTISYNTIGAQQAGTYVTSVSGTSPVVSSGGTTPAISMAAASSTVDGYLTSADWNTFNNKGSGTVTSVSGTAPISSSGGATPAISISQASSSTDGYLSSTDWNTFNNKGSGTVTSVTGTSPIASSGGATPAISISQASSTTNGYLSSTDWNTFNNKGSGTVTSVTGTSPVASSGGSAPAISLASGYGDTQNPYASKTANYVLAAPNGVAGVPTFRAIVAADIPTLNQNTTGTASNVTGTVAIANGGTGQTSASAAFNALSPITSTGDLIIGNGANSATRLAIGSSGQVLTSNGTTASWQNASGGGSTTKTWTAITASGTYTVPAGISSIRAYAFGAGGSGYSAAGGTSSASGGGGGCAYGDIAVTAGQTVTITISAGVATVTYGGTTMLTGNKGGNASANTGGTAGTATIHASVTNGGNYSGGAGGTSGTGGGSSGSPLGAGVAGGNSGTYSWSGAGWGGIGGQSGGGGVGSAASIGGSGGSGSANNTGPGFARSVYAAFTDPLLAFCTAPGVGGQSGSGVSPYPLQQAGNGAGGMGVTYSASTAGGYGGAGGFGGGGGCVYLAFTGASYGSIYAGAGGFGGGGGSVFGGAATYVSMYGGAGGYGGGGGCSAATGTTGVTANSGAGGGAIVLIYA